jgi:hypothetical protein
MTRVGTVVGTVIGAMLLTLIAPAGAERSPIPPRPNITDIAGDANGIHYSDVATPVQIPEADIIEAWFTNDHKTITAHWHVSAAPEMGDSVQLVMDGNPDPNDDATEVQRVSSKSRCLFFSVVFRTVGTVPDKPYTAFIDGCLYGELGGPWFMGKPTVTQLGDGTAIVSGTFSRTLSPALKTKRVITGIRARSWNADWLNEQSRPMIRTLDAAPPGRDYKVR